MTIDIPRSRTSLEKEARDYSAINIDLSHTSITNLTLGLPRLYSGVAQALRLHLRGQHSLPGL